MVDSQRLIGRADPCVREIDANLALADLHRREAHRRAWLGLAALGLLGLAWRSAWSDARATVTPPDVAVGAGFLVFFAIASGAAAVLLRRWMGARDRGWGVKIVAAWAVASAIAIVVERGAAAFARPSG